MNFNHFNCNGYRILPQTVDEPVFEDGNDIPIYNTIWVVADENDEIVFDGDIPSCVCFMKSHGDL